MWNSYFKVDRIFIVSTADIYVMNAWKHWLITSISERLSIDVKQVMDSIARKKERAALLKDLKMELGKKHKSNRAVLAINASIEDIAKRTKDISVVDDEDRAVLAEVRGNEMNEFCRFVSDPQGRCLDILGMLEEKGDELYGAEENPLDVGVVGKNPSGKKSHFVPGVCGEEIDPQVSAAYGSNVSKYYPSPSLKTVSGDVFRNEHQMQSYGGVRSKRFAMFIDNGIIKDYQIERQPHHYTWSTSEYFRKLLDLKDPEKMFLKFRPHA